MPTSPFADRLLNWWDDHGRKDLPWQHPRTPYRVWVSEIMLQQTQVITVIPYFERFIERFPEVRALAQADLDDVLAHWAGLGYYARARNLHKAAGLILEKFDGGFPSTTERLASLPGIGESTANAIISQAWDIPATVVDGNVRRVLARHDEIDGWPGKKDVLRKFWRAAERRLPQDRGADYTQAIMDLGATLCTRSKPRCNRCPVSKDCRAFQSGATDRYPASRPKLKISRKQLHMLIMANRQGQVLLERRPPAGIWGGLWSLPEAEDDKTLAGRFGLDAAQMCPLPEMEHRLTHMQITIRPSSTSAEPDSAGVETSTEQRWFSTPEWSSAGLPKPVLSLLQQHQEMQSNDAHG